ncbi:ParA family partition ATPase [Albimonas pacifica]|uniref:Plasmid segregation oscillating ATPase ParF n=1 Tax=Albimonas pacifica TaxID=1114924 RepID=A0A1I3ILC3_9RHOB|nr:ParA family partition ATPase [Albimonas pacifica]SFI48680.1 plasmid segregation oscillating ATPase ParF [Albimonas pacifica]
MTRTLVFAQQKGGAGKTTLLVQTAAALAAAGRPPSLVDLDPQRSLTRWNELRGADALPIESASEWQASTALRRAAKAGEIVLADCPGNADVLLRAAVRAADLVAIPCQPSPMDAWATQPILEMAAREKTPAVVILNRVPPRGGAGPAVEAALAEFGAEILPVTLGNRVAFSTAFLEGRAASEISPRSTAAREALALAEALLARLA